MTDKPVLLICGCKKYEAYLHAAIKRLAIPGWRVIGLLGDDTLEGPVYMEEAHILTVPISDVYERLPAKIYAAIAWIMSTYPETQGIYKTDEDILYGDIKQVATVVTQCPNIPYWGIITHACPSAPVNMHRIVTRFEDKSLRPMHPAATYCFGIGYWVHRDAIKHMLAAKEEYDVAALEDVCTGSILNRAGITPVRIPLPCQEVPRNEELLNL